MVKPTIANKNTKIKKTNLEQYSKMRKQFLNGKMSADEWDTFCMKCLDELLRDNSETLKKLKNI